MKLLQEALRDVKRLDDEDIDLPNDKSGDEDSNDMDIDLDAEINDSDGGNLDLEDDFDMSELEDDPQDGEPDFDDQLDNPDEESDEDPEDAKELDDVADEATQDPNKAGVIRTVPNAHLVYKRESEEGGYEELWVYNVGDYKSNLDTKKEILSGTDIPVNKTSSDDGKQTYTMWSAGNAEMIHIKGLVN